jgi:hypothetical protein
VSTSCAALMGTTPRSSPFWKPWPPVEASTPTTMNGTLPTVTASPTCTRRFCATVLPRTIFCARVATSSVVKKRPLPTPRALVISQSGLLPCTWVLQFDDVLTMVSRACTTGATAWMSGALSRLDRPATSLMVRVLAVPPPPKTPPDTVLPGVTVSRLVPSAEMRAVTASEDALPMPTVQITAATPKRMPRVVRMERSRCPRMPRNPVSKVRSRFTRPRCRRGGRRSCAPPGAPRRRRWRRG